MCACVCVYWAKEGKEKCWRQARNKKGVRDMSVRGGGGGGEEEERGEGDVCR